MRPRPARSVTFAVQTYFAGKSAVDESEIAGGQHGAGDPPREPDAQAVGARGGIGNGQSELRFGAIGHSERVRRALLSLVLATFVGAGLRVVGADVFPRDSCLWDASRLGHGRVSRLIGPHPRRGWPTTVVGAHGSIMPRPPYKGSTS